MLLAIPSSHVEVENIPPHFLVVAVGGLLLRVRKCPAVRKSVIPHVESDSHH
jgi:hypothetical protein